MKRRRNICEKSAYGCSYLITQAYSNNHRSWKIESIGRKGEHCDHARKIDLQNFCCALICTPFESRLYARELYRPSLSPAQL